MDDQKLQQILSTTHQALSLAGNADPTIKYGAIEGEIAGAVLTTLSNISDQKQRTAFQNAYNLLSEQDKQKLNAKLAASNSDIERLQILSSALVSTKLNKSSVWASNSNRIVILSVSIIFVIIIISGIAHRKKVKP